MDKEAWGVIQSMISAGAGILGVWYGGYMTNQREQKRENQERRHAALYLATLVLAHLDRLVESCIEVSYDDGTSEGRPAGENGYHQATTRMPEFDPLGLEVDWKAISGDLMYEVLNLPHRIHEIQRILNDPGFEDPPEHLNYFLTRQLEFTLLGLEVIEVAAKLRSFAGLPAPSPGLYGQSRDELLKERKENLLSTRREVAEHHATFAVLAPSAPFKNARRVRGQRNT